MTDDTEGPIYSDEERRKLQHDLRTVIPSQEETLRAMAREALAHDAFGFEMRRGAMISSHDFFVATTEIATREVDAIIEEERAALEAPPKPKGGNGKTTHATVPTRLEPLYLPRYDWDAFWDRDHTEAEWVYPDVLARGRGHAIWAAHKMGKSLLALYVAVRLATGPEPISVMYFDYEMTEDDVRDRMEDMGLGKKTDLARLSYFGLPTMPPLDTDKGAATMSSFVDAVQAEAPANHLVVFIDTIGRAVEGEENDADTFRDFYAHTGIELKRRGITWARLDHGGHEMQHQRGSSAKGDDVDVVWKLSPVDGGIRLDRDLARMSWVPDKVSFALTDDPLRYVRTVDDWPMGTGETANLLDRLNVSIEASTRTAQKALRTINEGRRREIICAALRWRKSALNEREPPREPPQQNGPAQPLWNQSEPEPVSCVEPVPEPPGTT